MLAAHMDEVALMIVGIESNGFLKFRPIGGVDPRVLVAKSVLVGAKKVPGVIGSKPIHLQKPPERKEHLPCRSCSLTLEPRAKRKLRAW